MSTVSAGPVAPGAVAPRSLFVGLVDDAALFPPGNAPMHRAVPDHLAHARATYAGLVGPFLCPASRLDELDAVLAGDVLPDGTRLDLTVVVDTGVGGVPDVVRAVARDDRLDLRAVEIPVRADHEVGTATRRVVAGVLDAGLPDATTVFVEVPRGHGVLDALDVLAEYDLVAKLRTGGADAAAHPDEAEVAAFLLACLDREVPLKCTAGLHHAVRHTAAGTGFEQHGYLNLLLAVHDALAGADADQVAARLGERDASVVADAVRTLDDQAARRVRRWFRSYGSCSILEPVDDLRALHLIDDEHADDRSAGQPSQERS